MHLLQVLTDTTAHSTYSALKDILGTETWQSFATQYFEAIVGMTISLLLQSSDRNQASPSTPVKFDILFLIKDNWKRILLSLLLIYAVIRFFPEIFGIDLSLAWCLGIGLSFDKLAQLIKSKFDILKVTRKPEPEPQAAAVNKT